MEEKELNRLKAVTRFLNLETSKKEELQHIVKLAAELCGAPTALITMIGKDTQFIRFKQNCNLETTAREDAFCNLVIDQEEILMIPDLSTDERFIDSPLAKANPDIKFYAGAPLITHDGYNLGSLCITDTVPNLLTEAQQKMLHILSLEAIQLLEFDSSLSILKEQSLIAKNAAIKTRAFFDGSASSYMLMDSEYHILAFNKAVKDFIQKAYGITLSIGMKATQFVHEEYIEDFVGYCSKALEGQTSRHERLLKFGEVTIYCDLTYNPARNNEGRIIGVSYNSIDITQRIRHQEDSVKRRYVLDKIAYIQSHELRKPVANIKGLLLLMEEDITDIPDFAQLQIAIDRLDKAIALIVNHTIK